jgi:hypothetical protein
MIDVEKEVEAILKTYRDALHELAARIREEYVVPFCKKYRVHFYASMGMYSFCRVDNHENLNRPEEDDGKWFPHFKHEGPKWEAYVALCKMLDHPAGGSNAVQDMGSLMDSYPTRDKWPDRNKKRR